MIRLTMYFDGEDPSEVLRDYLCGELDTQPTDIRAERVIKVPTVNKLPAKPHSAYFFDEDKYGKTWIKPLSPEEEDGEESA